MIDFNELISDESLAAFIDGTANSFESMKIASALPASESLSEVIDIVNSSKELKEITELNETFGGVSLDVAALIERINNNKIK